MDLIQKTVQDVKDNTGIELTLCDFFTGLNYHNKEKYFNVILDKKSIDYFGLLRYADKYKEIRVEPNGLNRFSIFIK